MFRQARLQLSLTMNYGQTMLNLKDNAELASAYTCRNRFMCSKLLLQQTNVVKKAVKNHAVTIYV